ncbi:hypothetical protein [Salipiger abyssi]|uniref:Uncharacterized protein n=1 Tax=Salipiger abyssi TaxID=1250539 RepID=A0A1P8UXK7_9RHOB|nr:hypothetical protein [Salipiger abyssi]ALF02114.1 hypothetical protein vBPeaSP1_023 [Pelagibaca phage vB_PeaS-P1]APZ54129.1 hypothetical protein Ga0080574_TMP3795 [Salipiger abyssi]
MASPAQIATDIRLWAVKLNGCHHQGERLDPLCRSLLRAADMLVAQAEVIRELEEAAEAESERVEAFQNGDDLYG